MATWLVEKAALVNAITATFKKEGTGAYQYTQIDEDISSKTNIPLNQKKRYFRVEMVDLVTEDLTSGKVLGRYVVEITFYIIAQKFDFEEFKSEIVAHTNSLLNSYNYNLAERRYNFTPLENRQATANIKLEVGLSSYIDVS